MGRRVALVASALVIFIAGFMANQAVSSSSESYGFRAAEAKKYPLLAKRLFIEEPNDPIISFQPLRSQLTTYFSQHQLNGSLYFEYLPTGTSIRVNGDLKEVAASLMKLPAAMDAYKAIEQGKIKADTTISLQQNWLDDTYGDLYKKGVGYQLTLGQAIQIMLEHSDNTALKAVSGATIGMVKPNESVLSAVDVEFSQNPDLTVSIGARSYGSFLKCLYFACYIDKTDSQQVLDYLSKTPFDDRLTAGINDNDVTVAHKIGVHSDVQSDCGIVYVPNRNYMLCIMLRGEPSDETDQQIAELSKLAYNYIKSK